MNYENSELGMRNAELVFKFLEERAKITGRKKAADSKALSAV